MGDPHGAYKAMIQCFRRSGFDDKKDRLICIGDVADGWPEVPKCIEKLLKIKDLYYTTGNHDGWMHEWLNWGFRPKIWTSQGGLATIEAYNKEPKLREKHRQFFQGKQYYYEIDKNLYVHGGFDASREIHKTSNYDMSWDRDLWYGVNAIEREVKMLGLSDLEKHNLIRDRYIELNMYDKVFIGHTSCYDIDGGKPVKACNVWNVDTGAGWEGVLTLMDVETEEYWQSDIVETLYPDHHGR